MTTAAAADAPAGFPEVLFDDREGQQRASLWRRGLQCVPKCGRQRQSAIQDIGALIDHQRRWLDDTGLDGFVDLRQDPEKFSYDKWTASLTSTTRRFQLEQAVELTLENIDRDNQYQANFKPEPNCGLKPPKEPKAD